MLSPILSTLEMSNQITPLVLRNVNGANTRILFIFFYFPNGRFIDCLSLTYATNKGKMLKLHYKYKGKEIFKVYIRDLMIRSSSKRQ